MMKLSSLVILLLSNTRSTWALVPISATETTSSSSSMLHYRNQIQADYDVGAGCGGTNMHSLGAFWKIPKLRNQPSAHTYHEEETVTAPLQLSEGACGGSHMESLSALTVIPQRRFPSPSESALVLDQVNDEEGERPMRATTNGCGGSNMNSLTNFPEIPKLRKHPSASLHDGYYQMPETIGLSAVGGCGGTYMESVGAFPVTHPVGSVGGNTDSVVYQQSTPLFDRYQQLRQAELQYQQQLAESKPLKGVALYAPDPW